MRKKIQKMCFILAVTGLASCQTTQENQAIQEQTKDPTMVSPYVDAYKCSACEKPLLPLSEGLYSDTVGQLMQDRRKNINKTA